MKIIVATIGSAGDVHPFLGLGITLAQRGHQVALATNPAFAAVIRAAGIRFIPIGSADDFDAGLYHPDLWHHIRGLSAIASLAIVPAIRPLYDLLAHESPRPAVVVASSLALGARIAQEHLGLPVVTVHLAPSLLWSAYRPPALPGPKVARWLPPPWLDRLQAAVVDRFVDPILAPPTNAFRSQLGLSPVRNILFGWSFSPDRIIGMFPEWFAPVAPDWPAQTRLTGFPLFDPDGQAEDSRQIEREFRGVAPLVFTPGSAMVHSQRFFRAAVDASRRLGRPALFLTRYTAQLPHPLPPGVIHRAYLPLRQVLPAAAALVHHGGIGTTAQALAAGIPQVLMPMAHDQPDNADRIVRLGVGGCIAPRQFTGEHLAEVLDRLMMSPSTARRCRAIASRCNGSAALAATADLVEEAVQ